MNGSTCPQPRRRATRAGEMNDRRRPRGGRTFHRALRALCALLFAAPAGGALAQVAPPHLDMLQAAVREAPPIDPLDIGSRTVAVELTLAGAPECTAASNFIAYGVQIDADLDPLTGIAAPPFDPLGVDARITAECDQASGQFISDVGPVVLGPPGPGGEVVLTITTIVAALPAVEFHWIAFAIEGAEFTRLPAAPGFALWAIHERSIP